jgi:hypothetical protein
VALDERSGFAQATRAGQPSRLKECGGGKSVFQIINPFSSQKKPL